MRLRPAHDHARQRPRCYAFAAIGNRDSLACLADVTTALRTPDVGRTFAAVPLRTAMVGDTRMPLLVLMASAALVLVITCANLAGAPHQQR